MSHTPTKPLTQQALVAWLREEYEIHVSPARVKSWVKEGCPVAPGPGKPRFIGPRVYAWLTGVTGQDRVALDVRDRMLERHYGEPA